MTSKAADLTELVVELGKLAFNIAALIQITLFIFRQCIDLNINTQEDTLEEAIL